MDKTLVIYEGKHGTTQKSAEALGYIIGYTKVVSIQEAPEDIAPYDNLIIVFGFYGNDTLQMTKGYLEKVRRSLKEKQIAAVGIGLSEKDLSAYVKWIEVYTPIKKEMTYFVQGELHIDELSSKDYSTLKAFTQQVKMPFKDMGNWSLQEVVEIGKKIQDKLRIVYKPMPDKELKDALDEFIKSHNMLALSTGSGSYVRCSPIEYIYDQGCFYLITEGGNKFIGLLQNPQVSAGIYDHYKGMEQLAGLQITGRAEMIPPTSERYDEVMAIRGVKTEVLNKLAVSLYMVEIKPTVFEFLCSSITKQGYGSKQIYIVPQEE